MMRWWAVFLLLLVGAFSKSTLGQSAPFVRAIASHVTMFEQARFRLQCPPGYIPSSYSGTSKIRGYYLYYSTEGARELIDRNNVPINRNTLSSAAQLDAGGYALYLLNGDPNHVHEVEAMVTCL